MSPSDPVLQFVAEFSLNFRSIERITLFGSRARGDATERSDYDLAFSAPGMTDAEWAAFALDLREKVPTLCGLDIVLLRDDTSEELLKKIRSEGKVIYTRA